MHTRTCLCVCEVDDDGGLFFFSFCSLPLSGNNMGHLTGCFMFTGAHSFTVTVLLEGERDDVNLRQPFVIRTGA